MPLLTLLAGPSTSLRDDVARCLVLRRPGLVTVAYDVHPAPDGAYLTRTVRDCTGTHDAQRVPLTGCCLSCTVLADAGPAVDLVAASDRWSEVVVALPAAVRPSDVAAALHGFGAVVDTVTTVVDARLLLAQLGGDDLLADRGLAVASTDRRSTAELVAGQLEDADVLAVADVHAVGTQTATTVQALLSHLAPLAAQVLLGPGGAGCDELVSTGRHDAGTAPQARAELAVLAAGLCPPACGVTTVVWQSDRALDPRRLSAALPDVVDGTVRSRGHVWLANRPEQSVRWEGAGAALSFGHPQPWTTRPGSQLVVTGLGLEADRLRRLLDGCVAGVDEVTGVDDDPFADALGPADRPVVR